MKKHKGKLSDELRPEYDLRELLKGGVRGKYAKRYHAGTNLILLDPDIRKAFRSERAVNDALRLVIEFAQGRNWPLGLSSVINWHFPTMERASKVIRKLSLSSDIITPEQMALAVWSDAVGKKIAAHTRAVKLVRTRLVVEVEDQTWQRQLFSLTHFIVRNIAKDLGSGIVEDVEFRVVPRRRDAARALSMDNAPPLFADDADAIADPVLRDLYKVSRHKALA